MRLRRLAQECDFGTSAYTLLRDIFVIRVRNNRLGERLLSEDAAELTFDTALTKAEAFERARTKRGVVATNSGVETNFVARGRPARRHMPGTCCAHQTRGDAKGRERQMLPLRIDQAQGELRELSSERQKNARDAPKLGTSRRVAERIRLSITYS